MQAGRPDEAGVLGDDGAAPIEPIGGQRPLTLSDRDSTLPFIALTTEPGGGIEALSLNPPIHHQS